MSRLILSASELDHLPSSSLNSPIDPSSSLKMPSEDDSDLLSSSFLWDEQDHSLELFLWWD